MQQLGGMRVFEGMGAIVCDVRDFDEVRTIPSAEFFSRGVSAQPERRCPCCNSVIYSRRHAVCGVCAEPLPAGCVFSPEEARSVEVRLNEERDRHRKWMQRFGN